MLDQLLAPALGEVLDHLGSGLELEGVHNLERLARDQRQDPGEALEHLRVRRPSRFRADDLARDREVQRDDAVLVKVDPALADEVGHGASDGGVQKGAGSLGALLAQAVVVPDDSDPHVREHAVRRQLSQVVDEVTLGLHRLRGRAMAHQDDAVLVAQELLDGPRQ